MGWEVYEVVPITCYYQTFGSYFYVCYLCHAMLVDVDWVSEIHDKCEIVKLVVYLRWQPNTHLGGLRHLFSRRTCLYFFGPPPRLKGIMRLFILETSVCSHKLLWALA